MDVNITPRGLEDAFNICSKSSLKGRLVILVAPHNSTCYQKAALRESALILYTVVATMNRAYLLYEFRIQKKALA